MNPIVRMRVLALTTAWAIDAAAAGPSYRIGVTGLACPVCAASLERQLRMLNGVEHVEVQLKENVVLITMKDGVTLDKTAADTAITDAGFRVNQRAE